MSTFKFNISLSVLNHLGRNLYRNFVTVLGEAISNSWDADAENVWIYIDREKEHLIVKDDGHGMNRKDFQYKFLKIGYSKRHGGINETKKGRPFIGRKGIGKLALLSCAEKISIITKTETSDYTGGSIDNSRLNRAIEEDKTTEEYDLEEYDEHLFKDLIHDHPHGTIVYFEDLKKGVYHTIEYIQKAIALYFRFSLLDKSFNIFLNDELITIDELDELSKHTEFLWLINDFKDPYLKEKLLDSEYLKNFEVFEPDLDFHGFIASVEKPSHIKVRGSELKATVDLFVNGRLREKDILKHIPTNRLPENYLYGQIHFNNLDEEGEDRFTTSRESIKAEDPLFNNLLEELEPIMRKIINNWDVWRVNNREDGDPENKRITPKERKSRSLYNQLSKSYIPKEDSPMRGIVEDWVDNLAEDAQFNFASYGECFISENLLRNYIIERSVGLSDEAKRDIEKWKERSRRAKKKANLSFKLRESNKDLSYLNMDGLANLIDKVDYPTKQAGLSRDATYYKPVRDALAHTSLLTTNAKNHLNSTFENIKARVTHLLNEEEEEEEE